MNEFSTYLDHAFEQNFVQGLYNNVVRDLYKILASAVHIQADAISISHTDLTVSKQGVGIYLLDISSHEGAGATLPAKMRRYWMSYRTGLTVILQHDAGVRQHLQLIEETDSAVSYHILLEA